MSTSQQKEDEVGRANADAEHVRRPYCRPRLSCLGTVRELTLAGATTPSPDMTTGKKNGG
jgi:hypothetical protein